MVTMGERVEIFERVRDLPYDTAAAHDAVGLREQGRGNCVAKAMLLGEELRGVGLECRLVCWEYTLPMLVDVQRELAFTSDVHTALQVRGEWRWILVDATHDPALASLGLAVGRWDGASGTEPACSPLGPVVPEDATGPSPLDAAFARIAQQVDATPPELVARYQRDLNQLFELARQ